jgi:hypothetical protein
VAEVPTSSVFRAGLVSAVALFGLAWLTDTYLSAHQASIVGGIGALVRDYPWVFALGVFIVCALTTSQSTSTRALVPIALGAGVARGSGCCSAEAGECDPSLRRELPHAGIRGALHGVDEAVPVQCVVEVRGQGHGVVIALAGGDA